MNFTLLKSQHLKSIRFNSLIILIMCANLCLNLCGCSTTSETFDCQPGKGVGCKSISEVNQMVDQQVGGKDTENDMQSSLLHNAASLPPPIISTNSPIIENSKVHSNAIPLSDTFTVQRMPEEYLRVWMAPFQDHQGNLHEGSVIHTVLKPGYWKMSSDQESSESHQIPNANVKVQ